MSKISKFFIIISCFVIIIIIFFSISKTQQMVVVIDDNIEAKPLKIQLGHYQDSDCGMVIKSIEYASQVINNDGKTWFFHDHGGMVKWLETKKFKDKAIIWVWAKDSKKWIDGRSAWYSRSDITPMNYGFGSYENKQENFINFEEMIIKMKNGENLTNPFVRKQLGM